jgi:hypothetical protein
MKEFKWPALGPNRVFDFEVTLTIEGTPSIGRGTDFDESLALEKASGEAVERALCDSLGISTVGVAVHPDPAHAMENARRERVERAIFDRHKSDGIPFVELVGEDFPPLFLSDFNSCDALKMAKWFESQSFGKESMLVCLIREGAWRFMGCAYGTDQNAHSHATIEALRNYLAFSADPLAFQRAYVAKPELQFCCGPSDLLWIKDSAVKQPENLVPSPAFLTSETVCDLSNLPLFAGCPVSAFRSEITL